LLKLVLTYWRRIGENLHYSDLRYVLTYEWQSMEESIEQLVRFCDGASFYSAGRAVALEVVLTPLNRNNGMRFGTAV
jgi:hypothetical protein